MRHQLAARRIGWIFLWVSGLPINIFSRMLRIVACWAAVILLALGPVAFASPWQAIVVGGQSVPEKLATLGLERYLSQVTGEKTQVLTVEQWIEHPVPSTLIGTREENPLLKNCDLGKAQGQPEGYVILQTTLKGQPVVMAAGARGTGAVNAVDGLLRELTSAAAAYQIPDSPVKGDPSFNVKSNNAGIILGLPLTVEAGHTRTPSGNLAVRELQRYLGKMFANPVTVSEQAQNPVVVMGTPESNPLIQQMIRQGKIVLPQGKNADQGYAIKTVGKTIYVAASTEIGMLYGVYALLEEYGACFQISGDCLPDQMDFQCKDINICLAPVFKYRGIMPWDNFLCGSSGYNEEDWQGLIMRATRMKLNKLDLHFYPGYVYYNDVWDGKPVPPKWPAQPIDFAPLGKPGAGAFGDTKLFCVRNWAENKGDPLKQAEASQAMLRRVIDYSHNRGWAVVAGFALMQPQSKEFVMTQKSGDSNTGGLNTPDPLQEKNVELTLQRYRRLQQIYPNADYYWLWQTEAGGGMCRQAGHEAGAKEMREKYAYWGGDARFAGDIDYAYLFLQVAKRLSAKERSKLATGGWSIEHLFPGIQKDFPKDIIFASLNNADPKNAVEWAENYKVATEGRRAWMIDWWEFDGNQWFPQFRTSWHEQDYKKAAKFGVESVSLLGWKLSAIEHHVRYLAEFSWNPDLTAKDFYRSYVERIYGKAAVDAITPLYYRYDDWEARTPPASPGDDRPMLLGAGWCSLAIPDVPFTKEGLTEAKWRRVAMRAGKILEAQQALLEEDRKSIGVLQSVLPSLSTAGHSWARLLIYRLEFRVIYLQAVQAMNRAFVAYDQVATAQGIQAGAKAAKKETAQAVKLAAEAIEKYAADVRNRGDLGAIGQLNVQFYDIITQLDAKFLLDSPYVTLNWKALNMNVGLRCDLANPDCWPLRGGIAKVESFTDDGAAALRVTLAGTPESKNGSRFIRRDAFDLRKQPLMDFSLRTTSKEPVAMMFQIEGSDDWCELDLVGKQIYKQIDKINPAMEINDGQWHRVTWNLHQLVAERIGKDIHSLKNLVVGTWSNPKQPVTVEFKNVCFGSFNQLDGQEVDR